MDYSKVCLTEEIRNYKKYRGDKSFKKIFLIMEPEITKLMGAYGKIYVERNAGDAEDIYSIAADTLLKTVVSNKRLDLSKGDKQVYSFLKTAMSLRVNCFLKDRIKALLCIKSATTVPLDAVTDVDIYSSSYAAYERDIRRLEFTLAFREFEKEAVFFESNKTDYKKLIDRIIQKPDVSRRELAAELNCTDGNILIFYRKVKRYFKNKGIEHASSILS